MDADEVLLDRFVHGDERAFEELVVRYEARVRNLVLGVLRDRALAEDVAQDAFLTAYRKARHFRGTGSFRGWLYRIALNRAQDELRRRKRRAEEPELQPGYNEPSSRPHEGLDIGWDLQRALEAIKPEHRTAVVLREVEGLSYREIAEALDWPLGTVQTRVHRARLELREAMTGPEAPGTATEDKDALSRR